jgi:hypothetical protein
VRLYQCRGGELFRQATANNSELLYQLPRDLDNYGLTFSNGRISVEKDQINGDEKEEKWQQKNMRNIS